MCIPSCIFCIFCINRHICIPSCIFCLDGRYCPLVVTLHSLVLNSQEKILQKYKISEINFGQIFCGDLPEFEKSKKIVKMAVTSPKAESKSQPKVMKVKRQETIHKYFKSPGKGETPKKSLSSDESKTAGKEVMPETKGDRPLKKQLSLPLGKQDSKKTLLSKKDVSSKKNLEVGKYENSGKKMSPLQQKQEKSPKKRFSSGTRLNTQKPSPTKKTPKKFSPDFGAKSAQKQQLAKKVKDKYKDAGNVKKRDATKNLLEKHKMNKTTLLKEKMSDRFVLIRALFQFKIQIHCDLLIIILPV